MHKDPYWTLIVEAASAIVRISTRCGDAEVRELGEEFAASWSQFQDANHQMLGHAFDLSCPAEGWGERARIDGLEPYEALSCWCHWLRQFLGPRHARIDKLGFFKQRPEWAEASVKLFALRRILEARYGASSEAPRWLVQLAVEAREA
ncbi:MAG: hypothetical protein U0353_34560, partial [Sandaracinus sp.]